MNMKRVLKALSWSTILFGATAPAAEPEPVIRIRPIEYTAGAALPPDLPQELFLNNGGRDAGSAKIKYLVEGSALVGIDKLSIDSIQLADGTEISKLREDEKTNKPSGVGKFFFGAETKDEPAWSLGTFPRVSHDGDYATFELDIHRPLVGKIESTKITGTATMLLGYDRKQETVEIPAKEKKTVDVGPFRITVEPVKPDAEAKPKAEVEIPFFAAPSGPSVDLTITGPMKSLDAYEMLDGAEQVNSWYSNEENKRTYHLPVPKTGKFTIKLGYWNTIKKVTAPLGDNR